MKLQVTIEFSPEEKEEDLKNHIDEALRELIWEVAQEVLDHNKEMESMHQREIDDY